MWWGHLIVSDLQRERMHRQLQENFKLNLFAHCAVDTKKQPDTSTRQCLKTTFKNSSPNMICDPIKKHTVVVSQHTKWVMRKTLYGREWLVWHFVLNTHNSKRTGCRCNSSHKETQKTRRLSCIMAHNAALCIWLSSNTKDKRLLYLFHIKNVFFSNVSMPMGYISNLVSYTVLHLSGWTVFWVIALLNCNCNLGVFRKSVYSQTIIIFKNY